MPTSTLLFNTAALEPGLILQGRNDDSAYGKAIRGALGSWGNHTAMIVKHNTRGWLIGEAMPPRSQFTPLSAYEAMIAQGYEVRIWRVKDLTAAERIETSMYWQRYCDGIRYPAKVSMARLAIFRFVNNIPWKIKMRGQFCTELVMHALRGATGRDPLPKPNGKTKKNSTPRTMENRYVCGLLEDWTDRALPHS